MRSGSEDEPSGQSGGLNNKFNKLKRKVKKLSSSLIEVKMSVMGELNEIKWNIKYLFHQLGFKYNTKQFKH